MNLAINFLGKQIQSPLILASGPLSHNGEAIVRAYEAGYGAVVTKTISAVAAKNPFPHLINNGRSLFNCEKWSDISYKQWISKEIPFAKKQGAVVIASIGLSPADVELLAQPLANSGADFIELVSYRSENIVAMVKEAVTKVKIPVIAKVSFNWPDCAAISNRCLKAGAAAISAIDSVGPGLRIDIRSGKPFLGSADGRGWISGEAIKPLALHCVAEISSLAPRAVIIGVGGISNAEDVVEMLLAGASVAGLCSLPIKKSLESTPKLLADLSQLLDQLGYDSPASVKKVCLAHDNKKKYFAEGKIRVCNETCTACNLCLKLCPYEAIHVKNDNYEILHPKCHLCGYCISICPVQALSLGE